MTKMSLGKIILSGLLSTSLLLNVACNKDNDEDKLNAQLAEKNKKVEDLETEKSQQQKTLDAEIAANKENVEKYKALEKQLEEKEAALNELKIVNDQKIAEHEEMIKGQLVTIKEKSTTITEQSEKIQGLEQEVTDIKSAMTALEMAVEKREEELSLEFQAAAEKNRLAVQKMENAIEMEKSAKEAVELKKTELEELKASIKLGEARQKEIEKSIKEGIAKADEALQAAIEENDKLKLQQAEHEKAKAEAEAAIATAKFEQAEAQRMKKEAQEQIDNLAKQVSIYKELFAGIEAEGAVERILQKDTEVTALISLYGVDEPLNILRMRQKVEKLNEFEGYKNHKEYSPSPKSLNNLVAERKGDGAVVSKSSTAARSVWNRGVDNISVNPLVNDKFLVRANSNDIMAMRDQINKDKSNSIFLIVRPINKVNVTAKLIFRGRDSELVGMGKQKSLMTIPLGSFDRSKLVNIANLDVTKPETYIFGQNNDVCKSVDIDCITELVETTGMGDETRKRVFQLFNESKKAIDAARVSYLAGKYVITGPAKWILDVGIGEHYLEERADNGEMVRQDLMKDRSEGRVIDGLLVDFSVKMISPIPSDGRVHLDLVMNQKDRITAETIKSGFLPIELPVVPTLMEANFLTEADKRLKEMIAIEKENGVLSDESITVKWMNVETYDKRKEIQSEYERAFK